MQRMLVDEWRVMIRRPRIVFCLAGFYLTGAAFSPAFAAPPASNNVGVQVRWAAREAVLNGAKGVSIGVYAGNRTYFWNHGSSGVPGLKLSKRTLFEIGSNTKTFTTALLGSDLATSRKKMGDTIGQYLPGYPLQPGMQKANLGMLATFTSSLPSLPPSLKKVPVKQRGVKFYSVSDFLNEIAAWVPPTPLPASDLYSNSSVGLLGLILGGDLKIRSWMERVQDEILDPLNMHHTYLNVPKAEAGMMAQGYTAKGRKAERWPIYAWAAAGALKSNTQDLVKYLRAYLNRIDTPPDLLEGMLIATQPRFKVPGKPYSQAFAWYVTPVTINGENMSIVYKPGGTGGFSSALAFSPELGIGVVVLTNRDNKQAPKIAQQLITRIATNAAGSGNLGP